MEKPKKKLSKKSVIICSVILAVVLAVGGAVGVIIHKNSLPINPDKIYTFDEVTMGLSKKVSYAVEKENVSTPDQVSKLLVQEKIEEYNKCYYVYSDYANTKEVVFNGKKYIEYWPDTGVLMHHLVFYDKNDNYIFETYEHSYGYIHVHIKGKDNDITYTIRHSM